MIYDECLKSAYCPHCKSKKFIVLHVSLTPRPATLYPAEPTDYDTHTDCVCENCRNMFWVDHKPNQPAMLCGNGSRKNIT